MFLTRLAVHRPITTLMASLIVLLLGYISVTRLAVDLMPDITYPTVSVVTLYPGAGPEEVETLITRPMEQALSSVNSVERLSSASMEGSSTVRVSFLWGTNLDTAISDMRQAVEKLRPQLPEEIESPYIRHYDVSDSPIMYLGLKSQLDPLRLTRLTEQQIVPQLERLDGVARVGVRGDAQREIQINVDRGKLLALNIGISEVVDVLRRQNVNQPAGDFKQGNLNLLIRSQGQFRNLEEIRNTVVRQNGDALVRIRDIAEVVDGEQERTELTRVNGEPGLMVYIFKQADANTIAVSDRVRDAIDRINAETPQAQLTLRFDKSDFIRQSISNIRQSALYGSVLAILVLILFLRSFRSTLVIGVSMPLSVLATFILIYLKGFTLNIVSFGGLALGIGLLVDNSIVVLESIFRKRDEGLAPQEAAIEGTREVASAIVASTLTTLIVFVPLIFISGMTGIMLHQLAWVVSFSLICSLLASLTLTPVLTAYWVKSPPSGEASPRGLAWVRVFHGFNHWVFQFVERRYEQMLRFSMRHAGVFAFLMLVSLTMTLGLSPRIGTEFLPETDEGDLRVDGVMAAGIQLETLDRQARKIENAILEHVPERQTVAAFIGDSADDAEDWNQSRFRVRLRPRSEREREIEEICHNLSEKIGPIGGMKLRIRAANESMLARMLTGYGGDIEIEVRGHDLQTIEELAGTIADTIQDIPGLVNVQSEKEDRRPELATRIDRTKASLLGISVQDISETLETTVRGTEATVFREDGDEFPVLVRLREDDRRRLSEIEQVGLTAPSGKLISLRNLMNFQPTESPIQIHRLDQQRLVRVSADVRDRDLGNVVADIRKQLNALPRPDGYSFNIAGEWEEQQKSFASLREGFVLAVLLMYMVMASQFESLRDPFLILVTLPLGAIGVILMLVLTGTTLNAQSFIGLVVLAGIIVNNAIVLIDYMNQLRASDPDHSTESLVMRAAVRRLRPILMTTLTTVLAMTPIALGWGEGGELQAPMARVVIGGLISGTLITLLAIPLLYQAIEKNGPSTQAKSSG